MAVQVVSKHGDKPATLEASSKQEVDYYSETSSVSSGSDSSLSSDVEEQASLTEKSPKATEPASVAIDPKPKTSGHKVTLSPVVKISLLAALSIQGATYLLLARHTRSVPPPGGIMYDIHDLVLMSEVTKLFVCCVAECWAPGGLLSSLKAHVWDRPIDAMKASVPAVIYVIQNSLTYVALSNLSAPLYVAMIQGKIFVTACVSVILLQRIYKARQWMCLVTLTFGLVMILLEQEKNSRMLNSDEELEFEDEEVVKVNGYEFLEEEELDGVEGVVVVEESEEVVAAEVYSTGNFWVGAMAVLATCFCSAFASVYMEKVMKKDDGASLYMRNIQLAFFGILVASGQSAAAYSRLNRELQMEADITEIEYEPVRFLHGFTVSVWCTCFLQAAGGLLIATIMKYLDSVMKGLAIAVSVVLITMISWLFMEADDDIMSPTFVSGATVIMTSVYFFSNPLPKALSSALGC